MLELHFRSTIEELTKTANIAGLLDEHDLGIIANYCLTGFNQDKTSRSDWESWYADAMKLALQVMEDKTFPWPNCSNVKFPLVTIGALNFHARAYPALVGPNKVVEYTVLGDDPDGGLGLRATRVTNHQNYLLLKQTDWEENTDRALINLPIMGCCFKKSYFDFDKKVPVSRLVLAMDLVVPYYTSSLTTTPRISEMFSLSPNAFKTRVRRGHYRDVKYSPDYQVGDQSDAMQVARQDAQHTTPVTYYDNDAPTNFVEQHCHLDLDGDGYAEPYIVTFIKETGEICRIVARYTPEDVERNDKGVVHIDAVHYYTKIPFIPSPDGGFYDLGFGMLLGPLNYAVDSILNQIIDAGTMSILGGGFLGRGVKIKRGENTFAPFEWKQVDSPGGSLRDNIVPLDAREPSRVLLDLLLFLVQYGERISTANEISMGEIPGQNTKTGVYEQAISQGSKVFGAIYKRIWRAFREEFQKVYRLTSIYKNVVALGGRDATGKWFQIDAGDYKLPMDGIDPAADPNVASPELQQKQAIMVFQTALQVPGQNVYKATMRMYKAFNVPNPDEIFPDPTNPKTALPVQPDAKSIEAQAKMQAAQNVALKMRQDHILAVAEMLRKIEESQAKVKQLLAQAELQHAQAQGIPQGHAIALLDAQIGAEKNHRDALLQVLDILMKSAGGSDNASGAATTAGTETGADTGRNRMEAMASPAANTAVSSISGGLAGGGEGASGAGGSGNAGQPASTATIQ